MLLRKFGHKKKKKGSHVLYSEDHRIEEDGGTLGASPANAPAPAWHHKGFLRVPGTLHVPPCPCCLSSHPRAPQRGAWLRASKWLGHQDMGTLGHRDTGTRGHQDTGTWGHPINEARIRPTPSFWATLCPFLSRMAPCDVSQGSLCIIPSFIAHFLLF